MAMNLLISRAMRAIVEKAQSMPVTAICESS